MPINPDAYMSGDIPTLSRGGSWQPLPEPINRPSAPVPGNKTSGYMSPMGTGGIGIGMGNPFSAAWDSTGSESQNQMNSGNLGNQMNSPTSPGGTSGMNGQGFPWGRGIGHTFPLVGHPGHIGQIGPIGQIGQVGQIGQMGQGGTSTTQGSIPNPFQFPTHPFNLQKPHLPFARSLPFPRTGPLSHSGWSNPPNTSTPLSSPTSPASQEIHSHSRKESKHSKIPHKPLNKKKDGQGSKFGSGFTDVKSGETVRQSIAGERKYRNGSHIRQGGSWEKDSGKPKLLLPEPIYPEPEEIYLVKPSSPDESGMIRYDYSQDSQYSPTKKETNDMARMKNNQSEVNGRDKVDRVKRRNSQDLQESRERTKVDGKDKIKPIRPRAESLPGLQFPKGNKNDSSVMTPTLTSSKLSGRTLEISPEERNKGYTKERRRPNLDRRYTTDTLPFSPSSSTITSALSYTSSSPFGQAQTKYRSRRRHLSTPISSSSSSTLDFTSPTQPFPQGSNQGNGQRKVYPSGQKQVEGQGPGYDESQKSTRRSTSISLAALGEVLPPSSLAIKGGTKTIGYIHPLSDEGYDRYATHPAAPAPGRIDRPRQNLSSLLNMNIDPNSPSQISPTVQNEESRTPKQLPTTPGVLSPFNHTRRSNSMADVGNNDYESGERVGRKVRSKVSSSQTAETTQKQQNNIYLPMGYPDPTRELAWNREGPPMKRHGVAWLRPDVPLPDSPSGPRWTQARPPRVDVVMGGGWWESGGEGYGQR
ncbi:hypothetical protein M231_04814 [Tremella mesenterica]|uniref:Uncharacterized protein n=1 Tax=Tremella mesenterica TaxID=5217 RepID=A0A4Q1BJT1_TREME|nr:hypothetical protein M231_04814 [Tremella mesenterica]